MWWKFTGCGVPLFLEATDSDNAVVAEALFAGFCARGGVDASGCGRVESVEDVNRTELRLAGEIDGRDLRSAFPIPAGLRKVFYKGAI